MLNVSLMSSPSTNAETPKSWAGVPALGEAGWAGPAKGVQGCQLWADKSETSPYYAGQILKNYRGLVPAVYN